MHKKSPFYIVDEFLSPLQCEDIVARQNNIYPEVDKDDNPLKTVRENELTEMRVFPLVDDLIPHLENYYEFERKGVLPFKFEWYVEGFIPEPAKCASFQYGKNKWNRISDIDFTGIVFLNDYNDKSPFDPSYEVCGGKLEFMNHKFGFNPKRGMLVFFPECPNFVNTISGIEAGELNLLRFHVVAKKLYNYNMNNFPGNYTLWFQNL